MPDVSTLLVPLRSNGKSLLAGPSVESVKRRIKFASLYFDQVLLEEGIFDMSAGPGGSSGFVRPPLEGEVPRWQTPPGRGAEQRRSFAVSVGRDQGPGAAPGPMSTAIASEATISWRATFLPFADELPAGTDWIGFTRTVDPSGDVGRISDRWKWADERNPALERAIRKGRRGAVIGHANRDLGFAAQYGLAVSVDPFHHQVVAQRFEDDDNWRLLGFAVPVLFPQIAELPWDAIADLRRDQAMVRLRGILRDVEAEAVAESASGDIEAAAHHAYERHLAAATGTVDSLGAVIRKTMASFVIGGVIGAATLPMPELVGFAVGTTTGGTVSAIGNVRGMIRQRRSKGWVSLAQRISQPPQP